jgi:lipid A 3-O-deacylase
MSKAPTRQTVHHLLIRAAVAAVALFCLTARAQAAWSSSWLPDRAFLQAGVAEEAKALVIGAVWTSDWRHDFAGGKVGLYWEASFGRWVAERELGASRSAWVTQLGITPVLRWQPGGPGRRWFYEAGIGANVLLPIYRSRDKRFSTSFNFGDHLAVGRYLGDGQRHELVLRIQHFSNAGIKHPNPGEDFLQVRYVRKI